MGKSLLTAMQSILLVLCFVMLSLPTYAQTPGLIYKIATNGGNKVLDPNGDGYVSKTAAGFQLINGIRLDEGIDYSEIPYRPFPVFMDEPLADLKTGGSYGHTDYAPKVYDANGKPVGSPLASYYDGKNFLFRVRLAGQSTASKGYSILIDTNNLLTGGSPNPGFEFEVVLATNFDVRVYDHRTNTTGGTIIFNGSVDQYSQKAIAGSTGGSDADYFYDFYVPMTAFGGAITESTALRLTGVTVTSAKSGIFGVASDIGGVNDNVYSGTIVDAWKEVINNAPTTTPIIIKDTGFTPVIATAPSLLSPIKTASTTISGFSKESSGSVITVYRNTTQSLGTTTLAADGSWTLAGISATLLQVGDKITSTVKPTDKSISPLSAEISVTAGNCFAIPPQITSAINGGKGFNFTTTVPGEQVIKIFRNGVAFIPTGSTQQATKTITAPANASTVPFADLYQLTQQGNSLPAGTYTITTTPAGKCESAASNQFCFVANNNNTVGSFPSITTSELILSTPSITGTFTGVGTISLYKNGVAVAGKSVNTSSASVNTWTITLNGVSLAIGDVLHVLASSSATCVPGASNSLTVQRVSVTPEITGTYCGATTIVNGTSAEAAGTSITVYAGTTAIGTTTVNAFGSWTATVTSQSSGTLTAMAKAPDKATSTLSAGKTISTLYASTGLAITGTATNEAITEGSTSVKGNGQNGALITLYINGAPYVDKDGNTITTLVSGGTFTFSNISPFELYAGAKLAVTAKDPIVTSSCESAKSAIVTVACNVVNTGMSAGLTQTMFCPGTAASVKLSTSEAGVIYNIYKKEADGVTYTLFGPSVLGTGSAITMQSDPVTVSGTIIQVKTIKVGAPCQYTIGGDMTVTLYPDVPKAFTVTALPENASCANVNTTITVVAAQTGYSYQLILNNSTKDKIGDLIVPTADGDVVFPPVSVSKTTTYGVIIKGVTSGCVAENTILKTITITGGPDVNRAVTVDKTIICTGSAATISIATENAFTYEIFQEGIATAMATVIGNGSTIGTVLTTPFATTGIKNFYVKVSGGSCTGLTLTSTVSISVTDGVGGSVSAGVNKTICGTSFTLEGSNPAPGSGTWSVVSKPNTAPDPVLANSNLYNTSVSGLVSGVYRFKWTVVSSCNGTTAESSVVIKVNCPAEYSLKATKFVTDYTNGEELATVTDPEGIKSVSVVPGLGNLPAGTTLNTTSGIISVSDQPSLVAGAYHFTLRTVDTYDNTSDMPLSMRFYSQNSRPVDITPLPVELIFFTATTEPVGVYLRWMTASELNNDHFEIERSQDGKGFTTIGSVYGNGTTNRSIHYSFIDAKPLVGVAYYRLKQVDYDQEASFSKIISINNKLQETSYKLQVFPNPVVAKLTVTLTTSIAERAIFSLYNLQGQQLYTQEVLLEKGINTQELNMHPLANGIYLLRVTGKNLDATTKVLKH